MHQLQAGKTSVETPCAAIVAHARAGRALNIGLVHDGFEAGFAQFGAWHDLIAPLTLGIDNLPEASDRPLLFIGNHTQFGMYDLPLLMMEMYSRGYQLTGLAHEGHWSSPMGPFFEQFGAIKASPMAAFRALRRGNNVLLFPGASPCCLNPQHS